MVISEVSDNFYTSYASIDDEEYAQGLLVVPEKCIFDSLRTDLLWCSAPLEVASDDYLEAWYQGAETSEDHVWLVDLPKGEATLIDSFTELSGRVIDVSGTDIDSSSRHLLLSNKVDGAL